jgi:hypothetical protein
MKTSQPILQPFTFTIGVLHDYGISYMYAKTRSGGKRYSDNPLTLATGPASIRERLACCSQGAALRPVANENMRDLDVPYAEFNPLAGYKP